MSYRPRNRQPRNSTRTDDRGTRPSRPARTDTAVPRRSQLHINTPVSIVLKADQATGRQVQGFIAEVLTSGDHPHGVKVRLTDGRVGRVQSLATTDDAEVGTSDQALGRNGEVVTAKPVTSGSSAARMVYEDARADGYDYDDVRARPGPSLEDYIVTKAPRRKKGKSSTLAAREGVVDGSPTELEPAAQRETFASTQTMCPVCHAFEGDEEAVAHHVGTHFE